MTGKALRPGALAPGERQRGMNDALLQLLRGVDTPTVCNAVEVAQGRRGSGAFTRGTMISSAPGESVTVHRR